MKRATVFVGLMMVSSMLYAEEGEGLRVPMPAKISNAWKSECGSCHMAYPPGLLPGRSWQAIMNGLSNHFGNNASLDKVTEAEIRQFLVYNSADHDVRPLPATAKPTPTPRITETAWFRRAHSEVPSSVFRRQGVGSAANCMACHHAADKGVFAEEDVSIPR
ncbi:diheme cytochrome c [Crenobacter sp. SG2305]|uniref:diheme cytochrome c n=1 Tax=Crenobacter oryzisoli TaxID=3056844 RepID=UPI0025AA6BF5|nr:diheme cytochrome c [Crenobacter sp. SG2305]MDN0082563.1 diheme cytochrome c [Crenobacter sp. SG2305]